MVAMKLLGDFPGEVVVLGVQPLSTEWSAELSAPVEKTMDALVDMVIAQLEFWQLTNARTAL
jgi:Ni,Fe-hydrogenase maturation factor